MVFSNFFNVVDSIFDKSNSGLLKKIYSYVGGFLRPYWFRVCCALFFTCVSSVIILIFGFLVKEIADIAVKKQNFMMSSFIFWLGIVPILTVANYTRFYLIGWLSERISNDMRFALLKDLVYSNFVRYNINVSDIISRFTTDLVIIQLTINTAIPLALRNFMLLVGSFIMMFKFSNFLSILLLFFTPIFWLPFYLYGGKLRTLSISNQNGIAKIAQKLQETLKFLNLIRGFNQQQAELNKFCEILDENFKNSVMRAKVRALMSMWVICLIFSSIAILFGVGGYLLKQKYLSVGELSGFIFYAGIAATALVGFVELFSDIKRISGSFARFFDLQISVNRLLNQDRDKKNLVSKEVVCQKNIVVEDVTFTYEDGATVLNNILLTIEAGQKVAILGASGTGKTTLLNLLTGVYTPDRGNIYIDDTNINNIQPLNLRKLIGVVNKLPTLFRGTIRENIAFGNPQATEEEIIRVSKAAFAHRFIRRLRNKYNTLIGEGNLELATGEILRVAIARMLLWNPQIVIIDDALSILDQGQQQEIFLALEQLMLQKTAIIMSSSINIIKRVDRVVLLDQGRIIATGKHQDLLITSPEYANFIKYIAPNENIYLE